MTNCIRYIHGNTELQSGLMYTPKCHSFHGGDTLDQETQNCGRQRVVLYGAMAGITRNEHKMCQNTEKQSQDFTALTSVLVLSMIRLNLSSATAQTWSFLQLQASWSILELNGFVSSKTCSAAS
jgi:hypothetical protein